jgi:hypothetical protein
MHMTTQRNPNFLIAGAGESGTSWLYASLLQHTQVYMPKEMRPEPHFFYKEWEFEKGLPYYLEKYFANVPKSALAVGERSSSYIFGENVAERIYTAFPDIKIIIMLREPVERAYSNWRFTVQSGLEWRSFESAIRVEDRRIRNEKNPFWKQIKPYAYLARSQYGEQIKKFFEVFPAKNILVMNSDTVKKNESLSLQQVCNFLGIDELKDYQAPGTFPTSSVQSKIVQYGLRKYFGGRFDHLIEQTRIKDAKPELFYNRPFQFLLKLNQTHKHPKLSPRTKTELEKFFSASNNQLSQYVDWDPSNWHSEKVTIND